MWNEIGIALCALGIMFLSYSIYHHKDKDDDDDA